ncbi:MAG TPA: hypothetical protein RMF84_07370, partial [Polyangiaceae bacterium LLY-WYZ-14_1]|nr:hypothetical protein [Polyangiaceae bacterium LLY-WYZ-14_1]
MKRFDGRGALAGLLMGWILCAGPAEAATGPITCGDTLGAGRHVLTGDIICGATDFQALTLLDGAILDLNGAVIQSGPVESFGIVVDGDGVTIEGPGALVGFQIAVSVQTPVA